MNLSMVFDHTESGEELNIPSVAAYNEYGLNPFVNSVSCICRKRNPPCQY